MWSSYGMHIYKEIETTQFKLLLYDYTRDGGVEWETWKSMEVIKHNAENARLSPWRFKGHWGNDELDCWFRDKLHKTLPCELEKGPTGPWNKSNDD